MSVKLIDGATAHFRAIETGAACWRRRVLANRTTDGATRIGWRIRDRHWENAVAHENTFQEEATKAIYEHQVP